MVFCVFVFINAGLAEFSILSGRLRGMVQGDRQDRCRRMNLRVKDFGGGIAMALLGLLFLSQSIALPIGNWNHPGPGALPKIYSTCLVCGGVFLMWRARSHRTANQFEFEAFTLRNIGLLFGAFVIFALLIRSTGLLLAAPCALILAYSAARGRSIPELVVLVVGITVGSALLFRYALGLPIPLIARPW